MTEPPQKSIWAAHEKAGHLPQQHGCAGLAHRLGVAGPAGGRYRHHRARDRHRLCRPYGRRADVPARGPVGAPHGDPALHDHQLPRRPAVRPVWRLRRHFRHAAGQRLRHDRHGGVGVDPLLHRPFRWRRPCPPVWRRHHESPLALHRPQRFPRQPHCALGSDRAGRRRQHGLRRQPGQLLALYRRRHRGLDPQDRDRRPAGPIGHLRHGRRPDAGHRSRHHRSRGLDLRRARRPSRCEGRAGPAERTGCRQGHGRKRSLKRFSPALLA